VRIHALLKLKVTKLICFNLYSPRMYEPKSLRRNKNPLDNKTFSEHTMNPCLLLVLVLPFVGSITIQGLSEYDNLITQWSFAYEIANPQVEIDYLSVNTLINGSANPIPNTTLDLITDVYTDFSNLESTKYVVPIINTKMAIVYNIPSINTTLKFTKHLIKKMLVNITFWNDPELVELNPELANVGGFATFILNVKSDAMNKMVIDYFFENVTDNDGSWLTDEGQLVNPLTLMAEGYSQIASTLAGLDNSIAFVPLPLVQSYIHQSILNVSIFILDNGLEVLPSNPINISITKPSENQLLIKDSLNGWPFQLFGYFIYDTESSDCQDVLNALRFFYWDIGNEQLYTETLNNGFTPFDNVTNFEFLQPFLKNATCKGNKMLVYNNLSSSTRSNVVFGMTISGIIICIFMVVATWVTRTEIERKKMRIAFNYIIGLIGLSFSLSSFVIWWYPPSSDTFCSARYWTSGLGYTNDIGFIFFSVYAVRMVFRKVESGNVQNVLITLRHMFAVYAILELIEILILILWQVIEKPKSVEVVVSQIEWTSVYQCSSETNVIEIIQFIYFCLISISGCYMVYKYWIINNSHSEENFNSSTRNRGAEDGRLILVSLCNQILIFILLSYTTLKIQMQDDQLYIVINLAFLFLILNIFLSFFARRLFLKVQSAVNIYSMKSQGYDQPLSEVSPTSSPETKRWSTKMTNSSSSSSNQSSSAPSSPPSSIPASIPASPDRSRKLGTETDLP
jgi:ABC-type phosphate transport system substrate-binding protein